MFESYYGFTQTPFTRAVAPAALYGSEQHRSFSPACATSSRAGASA